MLNILVYVGYCDVSVKRIKGILMHVEVWNHRELQDNPWLYFHKAVIFRNKAVISVKTVKGKEKFAI
jgi:hypothetical protein